VIFIPVMVYLLALWVLLAALLTLVQRWERPRRVIWAASILIMPWILLTAFAGFFEFDVPHWGRFLVWVLLGALYIIAGFFTFENPLFAAAILTLLLGASLVASGIVRIILAFSMKREQPWIWLLLSSIVTLLLGLLILAHWPISSAYVLGMFLGLDLVMAGAGWIGLSLALHHRGEGSPAKTVV